MTMRVLPGLAALACVFAIHSEGSAAQQNEMRMVMPDALAALERMGEHLKALSQFALFAATTSEDVLDGDEKVMIGGEIAYRVKTPNRFILDIVTDKRERHYFYDGKTVTVYAPSL